MSDCYTCKHYEQYEWEDGYLDEWCSLFEEDDTDFFGGNCKHWEEQE